MNSERNFGSRFVTMTEYDVVDIEKSVSQLSPEEVMCLAIRMNATMLHTCCQMAMRGGCTWKEAMQTAAIEQAKAILQQQSELERLYTLLPRSVVLAQLKEGSHE